MKAYTIKVNGKVYQVEVEEGISAPSVVPVPAATVNNSAAPTTAAAEPAAPAESPAAAAETAAAAPVEGAKNILAPMPGTVLEVMVEVGQKVEKNAVLCILEAMKMENEIMTPQAGTVVQVACSRGKSVNAGALLFSIQE